MKKTLSLAIVFGFLFFLPLASSGANNEIGGYIDFFERSETEALYNIRGWAYNPNAPANSVEVQIYIDGARVASIAPTAVRQDVIAATGVNNVYGFAYELPTHAFVCPGECKDEHEILIISRDLATGEQFLLSGGRRMIQREDIGLFGYVDGISVDNAQSPEPFMHGWVADSKFIGSNHDIYIMSEGKLVGHGSTETTRMDVIDLYGQVPLSVGFIIPIDTAFAYEGGSGATFFVYVYDSNYNQFEMIGAEWHEF